VTPSRRARVEAALLPRIVPIGDIDEDELVFAETATGPAALDALDLPPGWARWNARFLLARLVHAWADGWSRVRASRS